MHKPGLTLIGVITSAHGVRGEVKLRYFTDTAEQFLAHEQLADASGKSYRIKKRGVKESLLIVAIEGLTDRDEAERLRGTELFAPAESEATGENQWRYRELIGLQARLDNGTAYGKVIGVYNFGAGDVLELELPDGNTEMLPFNNDFTGSVHADEGYLVVTPPDYLEADGAQ